MLEKLEKLLEVKKIIALLIVSVFCILSFKGDITPDNFNTVAVMIVTFYFTQSSLKNNK